MQNWKNSLKVYSDKRIITILLLGFSSGLPLLLIASTLSLWLDEVGVGLSAIGMFALVKGPYSFKFLISPIIDRIRITSYNVCYTKLLRRSADKNLQTRN